MSSFADLVASRREWIDRVLIPWCRTAALRDLLQAEAEWTDVAGRADPEATLWTWAWSRFPDLVHRDASGLDETRAIRVTLADGTTSRGFPDARQSRQGRLVLVCMNERTGGFEEAGPFSIDELTVVEACET
ncbi:MAG: hypothetical protein KY476_13995 [Planctomycetes bacterium]|nr:hypothetical protein [Planctomycetota bacterium]